MVKAAQRLGISIRPSGDRECKTAIIGMVMRWSFCLFLLLMWHICQLPSIKLEIYFEIVFGSGFICSCETLYAFSCCKVQFKWLSLIQVLLRMHRYAYSEEVGDESDDEEAQSLTKRKPEGELSLVKQEKNVGDDASFDQDDEPEEDKRE